MRYLITVLIAVLAGGLAWCTTSETLSVKIRLFHILSGEEQDNYQSIPLKTVHVAIVAVCVSLSSFFAMNSVLATTTDWIAVSKATITLLCLVGAGCFDFRQKRIPNFFPVLLALSAVVLLASGVIAQRDNAVVQITSSAIASIGCGVVLVLAAVITKEGIGFGDIKLICAVALMMGMYVVLETIFFGAVCCSVFTIVVLIGKKDKNSKSVPFAPFLLIGYIVTLCMNNF